jgi:hypothetical protein
MPVKRIAALAILFVALTEFGIERQRFDLWVVIGAVLALLWNVLERARDSHAGRQKHDCNVSTSRK